MFYISLKKKFSSGKDVNVTIRVLKVHVSEDVLKTFQKGLGTRLCYKQVVRN